MAIRAEHLADLDRTKVAQNLAFVRQILQERYPYLDLRRGVIHDLLLLPQAALAALYEENVERLRRSLSLAAIRSDPSLADADVVDAVLSNFFISRRPAETASGTVAIVLNKLASVTIPAGAIFEASGQSFSTRTSFAAKASSAAVASETDRVLTPNTDGTFSFTISVVATSAGEAGRLKKDTALVPKNPIPHFVRAYAAEDFQGGANEETNQQLINRLVYGVAAKVPASRISMSAMLRDRFPNVVADSLIGFGDAEMQRDRRGIFPISQGGSADWYVRTATTASLVTLKKDAVFLGLDAAGGGLWQISIGREDCPGFYDVWKIAPAGSSMPIAGSYEVASDVRSYDLSPPHGLAVVPDIASADEAAYSRFQTAVVSFRDPDTSTAGLVPLQSTKQYEITLRGLPGIADIQDAFSARDTAPYGGDLLVKAPVPCFLSVSFSLEVADTSAVDTAAIANAIAETVNRLGFTGKLPGALVADAAYSAIGDTRAYLTGMDLFGRIRRPNGSWQYIRSRDALIVPTDPDRGVSPRTVAFFLDPADVAIAVSTAAPI